MKNRLYLLTFIADEYVHPQISFIQGDRGQSDSNADCRLEQLRSHCMGRRSRQPGVSVSVSD